ncbi:MAG TPA: LLM class flavin-dependent oxidoreductase [Thermoplasmata archaeon]|nr:LLM class flavin-dependent oxidoreductase [Thermoplasmata archaeon]
MRLSAFSVLDAFPEGTDPSRDRHREALELAEECERSGLHGFWLAEHHFHSGGLCPSPPVLLAAIGERTKRIRLGVMVSPLPFHEPVDLAEQYGLVDRLSRGRLELGVGSGYIPKEFEGFGLDPATKRERFESTLATLLSAFRGEPVRAGPGARPDVTLNVLPLQKPSPPITVAVQRREALVPLARLGRSIALIPYATVANVDELSEEIREYRAALPKGADGKVAAAVHIYAGSSVDPARAALQRYLDSRIATQSKFYEEKVQRDPSARSARSMEASGLALLGAPKDVVRGLERYEAAGVDELLGIFDFGGLPLTEVLRSVRGIGEPWSRRA